MLFRMFTLRIAVLVLIWLAMPLKSYADGIQLKDGRFDGPTLEIKLTPVQEKSIKNQYRPGIEIRLSQAQRRQIAQSKKMRNPPTRFSIFKSKDLEGDCTCSAANYGLLYREGWIEIPLIWVVTDTEAVEKRIVD
jgi:hypothetical protein